MYIHIYKKNTHTHTHARTNAYFCMHEYLRVYYVYKYLRIYINTLHHTHVIYAQIYRHIIVYVDLSSLISLIIFIIYTLKYCNY